MQDEITIEDVFLLYAIKNDIPTNQVEVLKDHMTKVSRSNAHYLPYDVLISNILVLHGVNTFGERKHSCTYTNVINRKTLVLLGLVRTLKVWCFKGEENQMYYYGSTFVTCKQTSDHVSNNTSENFSTNLLQLIVYKLNQLEIKVDRILQHGKDEDSSRVDSTDLVEEGEE